jgi:hypothetical protein
MMIASGAAPAAMFCGRLKTPDPIIDPTTTAVSANSPSFPDPEDDALVAAVVSVALVIVISLTPKSALQIGDVFVRTGGTDSLFADVLHWRLHEGGPALIVTGQRWTHIFIARQCEQEGAEFGHCPLPASTNSPDRPDCDVAGRMPSSLVRLSRRALIATSAELPDIARAAICGLRRNG